MSKSTLRKRIALTATTALFAGLLSFTATPAAFSHVAAGQTNVVVDNAYSAAGGNSHLLVATQASTSGASIVSTGSTVATLGNGARSIGLLSKDTTTGTAQTATVLAGGALCLLYTSPSPRD